MQLADIIFYSFEGKRNQPARKSKVKNTTMVESEFKLSLARSHLAGEGLDL
jgi:hypothetical protein